MHPLNIDVSQFGTADENVGYIESALERGLPELYPVPFPHDRNFVLVGSGCSVTEYVEDIRKDKEDGKVICAIKGSHDWLMENDIVPDCFISVEPRDRTYQLERANDETVYLLASRVYPGVFDKLKDRNVVLWHSWSEENECEAFKGHIGIGGGTTSGLRAVNVGFVLGFRKFKLYGFDSCLSKDKTKKRFTGEGPGAIIDVTVGEKTFWCTHALAQQAQDFQNIYKIMDVNIESIGDGLISAIINERKRMGFKT